MTFAPKSLTNTPADELGAPVGTKVVFQDVVDAPVVVRAQEEVVICLRKEPSREPLNEVLHWVTNLLERTRSQLPEEV